MNARLRDLGAVLCAAAFVATACDWMPGRPLPEDRPKSPEEIMEFGLLYAERCAGCHGSDGELGPAREFASPTFQEFIPDEVLRRVIRDGVPGTAMPAFVKSSGGPLTDLQVEKLVAGMRARWARAPSGAHTPLPPYSESAALGAAQVPADAGRGHTAFLRACAECHGRDGSGGKQAGSVVDPAFVGLVSDQMLRTAIVCGRPDLGMPAWSEYPADRRLTFQEISDVVAWLASHRVGAASSGAGETHRARGE